MGETFIEEFEIRDGVVCLKPDLGDEVDDDEDLDVSQFENTAHGFVDFPNGVLFPRAVFFLEDGEAEGDEKVGPAPESEVGVEGEEAVVWEGTAGGVWVAEVLVGEVGAGEGEEDGVGEELAGCEAYCLCGGGVGEVGRGEES